MKLSRILSNVDSTPGDIARKPRPWISSPNEEKEGNIPTSVTEEGPETRSDAHCSEDRKNGKASHQSAPAGVVFKRRHESATIKLFCDLFFVANLSTFTASHEINNGQSLASSLGFFTLMWFTWLQTSLFDVRFAADTILHRLRKSVSFAIMSGFAFAGALYDTSDVEGSALAFRFVSIVLMVSRLALAVQYGTVWWCVKKYRGASLPIACTIVVLFVSAMVLLGLTFGFSAGRNSHTYVGWCVLVVVEAIGVITISCVAQGLNLHDTYFTERTGLLTLIILGEGIIGMTKSVSTILQNSTRVSGREIGLVIVAVMLIHAMYILYFDQIDHHHIGMIRQQIWTLLHYPLHVAMPLTVEGNSRFIVRQVILDDLNSIRSKIWQPSYFNSSQAYASFLKKNLTMIDVRFRQLHFADSYNYSHNLTSIAATDITSEEGR